VIQVVLAPRTGLPAFVQIEPVGRCNLRCRMCPVQFREHGGASALLEFDAFQQLLDGFSGVRELHLQGLGEPLMHPRFFDMVSHAAARGIAVSTNTNLTLLTPVRAERAATCGLAEISVSLDAASAPLYESIRLGARLPRVLRNLRRLMQACRAAAHPPHVRIVMVLMRRNLHELGRMVELAAEHGVDALFVQRLCHDFSESSLPPIYRSMRDFVQHEALGEHDREAMAEAFEAARTHAATLGVTLRLPRITPRTETQAGQSVRLPRCDWPWRGAYVSCQGDAMPCCMVATPDRACLGNMLRDGVEATWNGAAYQSFRAGLLHDAPAEICRTCSLYQGTF
jgi:MoaA/NifB/PqqE/SkfB family radical SAM enzyme